MRNWPVLSPGQLTRLTKACPKLEAFIGYIPMQGNQFPGRPLEFNDIVRGVLPCKNTLRHSEIRFGWLASGYFPQPEAIASLKEFANLRALVLDCACLCYGVVERPLVNADLFVEMLPESIETTTINSIHPCMYEPILGLAWELRNGTFPHLKTFTVRVATVSFELLKRNAMSKSGVSFLAIELEGFSIGDF